MGSDKRSGAPGATGAARGPRPVVKGPGSVNRGFESVDPERQREADAEGGNAAHQRGRMDGPLPRPVRARRPPASGGAGEPGVAKGSCDEPGAGGGQGGSA